MKKITKEINFDKKKLGKICFLPNDNSVRNIEKQVLKSIKKLKAFYNINVSNINIELVYSRKELNKKLKRKTPNWLIGTVVKNKIYIFSLLSITKHNCHKNNKFNKLINHELCHIFNAKLNKKMPIWLDEGIALYLSRQEKKKDFKKSDWQFFIENINKNISFNSFLKHDGYKVSYWLVKKLFDNSNKNKLLKLIKKPSLIKREGLLR